MTIAFVQSKSAFVFGGTSLSVTLTSSVTSGNALIAACFDGGGKNLTDTVSDNVNAGNYTRDATANLNTDGDTVGVFSKLNVGAGSTTLTLHGTGLGGISAHEYSGLATSSAFDKSSTNNTTGTSATSGSTATTSQANELLFGMIGTSGGSDTVTAGSSYTLRESNTNGHVWTEDQIVSSTGAYAATFNITSGSDEYTAIIATYQGAGGGGGVTVNLTGQTATFTEGSLGDALSYGLTGQTGTFTEGTITAMTGGNVTLNLTGQTATFSEGSLADAVSYGLTEQSATFSEGALADGISYGLTAQTATFSEGALSATVSYGLTGKTAAFTEGTISASTGGSVTLNLTGQTATFSEGAISAALSGSLTGQTATFSEGSISRALSYNLTAHTASFTEGSMSAAWSASVQLTGLQASFVIGAITATVPGQGIQMPNLIGLNYYEALLMLQEVGVYIPQPVYKFVPSTITVTWAKSNLRGGFVTAQSIAAGLSVQPNQAITLTVSNFPFGSMIDSPPDWDQRLPS